MKIGDTVKLKSGGPLMLIESFTFDSYIVIWMSIKNELQRATIRRENIVKIQI